MLSHRIHLLRVFFCFFSSCITSFHLHSMFKLILIRRNWVSLWLKIKYPQSELNIHVCPHFLPSILPFEFNFVCDCTVSMVFIISLKIELGYWHRPRWAMINEFSYIKQKSGSPNTMSNTFETLREPHFVPNEHEIPCICLILVLQLEKKERICSHAMPHGNRVSFCHVCDCAELIYRFIVWSHACRVFLFFPATFGYIIFYRMELLILHALLFSFLFNSFVRFASVKECINITVQTVLYFVLNFLVTHFLAIQNH